MALTGAVVLAGASSALAADATGPRLTVAGPAHGSIITAPTKYGVSAVDRSGVRFVTFSIDGDLKAVDRSRPFAFRLDPRKLRPGSHRLTVASVDRHGHRSSVYRTFRVGGARSGKGRPRLAGTAVPPALSMSWPAAGATLSGVRTFTASAWDASGISDVRFYLNGVLRKTERLKPYEWSFNWSNVSAGTHSVKVIARDNQGATTTVSRGFVVANTTVADTTAPVVTLTGPADGSVVSAPAAMTATAKDAGGVRKVEFLVDGVVKATDTSSPYAFTFSPAGLAPGAHVVAAVATDPSGNAGQASRTYVVPAPGDTAGPTLSISGPAAGSILTGTTKISAVSSDPSGVREVRFLLDGVQRATDLASPYEWTYDWSTVAGGTHTVRIDAYDTLGNLSTVSRSYSVPTSRETPPPPPSSGTTDAQFQSHWQWLSGAGAISASQIGPWDGLQAQASDRIVAVSSPRQGMAPYAVRFTVKPGDYAGGGQRAELWSGGEANGTELEGTDRWYSFAEMFPSGFDSGKWTLFHQIHGGSGRPVVAFQGEYGKMVVMMRGGDEGSPTERRTVIDDTIATDVWHDFIYHVRWYADSRGLLEVWHRIPSQSTEWTKVLTLNGPVGYKSNGTWHRPYPKVGLYRDPSITWTTVAYNGGLHMRSSSFTQAAALFG